MKCKNCGKKLYPVQVLYKYLQGDPFWQYCNDNCFFEALTNAIIFGAFADGCKRLLPKIEKEMDNILVEIDNRMKEIQGAK